jgi:hypothetical protein
MFYMRQYIPTKWLSLKHLITNISQEIGNSDKILEKLEIHSGLSTHSSASSSPRNLSLTSDLCPTAKCSWEYLSQIRQCSRATGYSLQKLLICCCVVIATGLSRNVRIIRSHHALELCLEYMYRYIDIMFLMTPHILLTTYEVYVAPKIPALFSVSTNKRETPRCSVVTPLPSIAWKILSYESNNLKA